MVATLTKAQWNQPRLFFETTPGPPHLFIPTILENLMRGETQGLEIAANWKVSDRWTLSPGYAFRTIHMHLDPSSQDTQSVAAARKVAR